MSTLQREINYLIINEAIKYLGVEEVKGKENNAKILDMLKSVGFEQFDEETPWCAAFVGHVLKTCRLDYLQSLHSRDYASYGCASGEAVLGNIAVFWRDSENSTKGHVGFYLHMDDDYVWILGGNQSNMVSVQKYPRKNLLAIRQALLAA